MDSLQASRINGGNTAYKRNESDFYPTPSDVTIALLNFLSIPKDKTIWEPACGQNHIVNTTRAFGYDVIGTDIQTGTDFLTVTPDFKFDWIITNPPFSISEDFIYRCAIHWKPFALLLKSQYWNAKRRLKMFREYQPKYILPLTWRPDFLFKSRGSGSPFMDMMWCVWDSEPSKETLFVPLERPNI